MKVPTLKTIPVDMTLTIGKYLNTESCYSYPDIDDDISAVTLAALLKDKEMLEHLIERHPNKERISGDVALAGNLQVLKWTIKRMKCPMNARTSFGAARGGHLEILKYLKENACPWHEETSRIAARRGHLEILKYLKESACPWHFWTCQAAAEGGHFEILKYLHQNGCPAWNEDTCRWAARRGDFDMLKYLKENDCPWNEESCSWAALGGHLDMLKYLRENDCPWNFETCYGAAIRGHADVLRWAIDNGCSEPRKHDDWWDPEGEKYDEYIRQKNALLEHDCCEPKLKSRRIDM